MKYDVIVIGGGPAGMMAAGRAGQLGQSVLLLEKNKELGMKLSITGKNRCNVTHYSENKNELIDAYGKNGKFLYSSLAGFSNLKVIDFFESHGVKMKIERGNRVFPVSNKSSDICQALLVFLAQNKVEVRTGETVVEIIDDDKFCRNQITRLSNLVPTKRISQIVLASGEKLKAKKYIITTGGLSYSATGSTGDGYEWARQLGHTIIKLRPALSPIILTDWFIEDLEGSSLRNIEISIFVKNKKILAKFGEVLFTKRGISGPVALEISKKVGELLEGTKDSIKDNRVELKIDLKPALDFVKLDKRIQRDFQEGNNKQFRNVLGKLLPKKLIPVVVKLSKINSDKRVNLITKEERRQLVRTLKEFPLHVDKLVGFSRAIITTGGIDLREVNSRTMQSRLVDNLYFAGEVLDLDGPTGGYNLQICWSTGWVAGSEI